MLTLAYNNSGVPYYILNSTSGEAIVFRYSATATGAITASATSGLYLREIDYVKCASGTTSQNLKDYQLTSANTNIITSLGKASYTYNSIGQLVSVKDNLANYTVNYQYTSGKVTNVSELGGTTAGQTVGISYGVGYAEVRSSGSDDVYNNTDDIITRYVVDAEGRVISYYTMDSSYNMLGAASGVYESQENIKNNIKESATVGGSATSYLHNGDFENGASYWTKTSNVYVDSPDYDDTHYDMRFDVQQGVTDSITQTVSLPAGNYTLSAEISVYECQGVTVTMKATVGSTTYSEAVPTDEDNVTTHKFSPVLHLSSSGENCTVKIEVVGSSSVISTAEVIVDKLTLYKGIGTKEHNLIEMADFESHTVNGTAISPSTYWAGNYVVSSGQLFGNAARVNSCPDDTT